MADDLRDRFETFRTASTAQTDPPGVPAIRRTIARRHATRAALFAAGAAIVVALALVPLHDGEKAAPVHRPIPSSGPSTPSNPPRPQPNTTSGSPTTTPSQSIPKDTGKNTQPTRSTPIGCAPLQSESPGSLLDTSRADDFALSQTMLKQCPDVRIEVTRALYVGPGATSKTLTLKNSTSHTLTAQSPSTTLPTPRAPAGTCYTSFIVTVIGAGLPHSMPNLVDQLAESGDELSAQMYFGGYGATVLETSWSQPSC